MNRQLDLIAWLENAPAPDPLVATEAVKLQRIDRQQNMARFYFMRVQQTLFGEWALVREWGRIGRGGQCRSTPYPTPVEAGAALEKIRNAKVKRGYLQ